MIDIIKNKAISKLNNKKALVFIARKKWFKPIYVGKTKSFTGYQTIASFQSLEKEMFVIDMDIYKGSCALIIVQNNSYQMILNTTSMITKSFILQPGPVRLRLVGKNANVKYRIDRKIE